MALPTPLTPAQADGALNAGEARVLFLEGPREGQFLVISATDPDLPDALIDGTVMAHGIDLSTTGAVTVPLTLTLANGNPIPNPPASYPINALVTVIGNIPAGQSLGLLSIENVRQTVPLTESGTAPTKKYTTPWVITEPGSYVVELLLASGHLGSIPFNAVTPPPTHNDAEFPAIVGNMWVGQTVTADPAAASWTGSPVFTYQWKRSGVAISGAVNSTYTLTQADAGASIDIDVTGTNAGGSLVVSGNTRGPVLVTPANTAAPVITGTPEVGQTLTVSNGTWTGSPTFTRQWMADNSNIAGATAATFVLTSAEDAMMITCRVTGTNGAGNSSAVSAAVGPVTSP